MAQPQRRLYDRPMNGWGRAPSAWWQLWLLGALAVVPACGSDDVVQGAPEPSGPVDAATEAAAVADAAEDAGALADSSRGADRAIDAAGSSDVEASVAADVIDAPIGPPTVLLPRTSLEPSDLAILVNDDDPQSVAVADYYQKARGVPLANVIHLKAPLAANWPQAAFKIVKADVDARVASNVQAYAVTWTQPYSVDGMSLVSAFALGFDTKYTNTTGGACGMTAAVDYYQSDSTRPWTDHKLRPAMMLAGATTALAKAVVDRGVAADGTFPDGDGYFVRTTDPARSVRYFDMQATVTSWNRPGGLKMFYIDNSGGAGSDVIQNKTNVLFYLTGLASVASIDTNQYRPGAVADHLTSYGGPVPTSGQMSIAKWLEAGATASYGTIAEPCNYTAKFPVASVLVPHYFRGETVLEAYWKSVHWPGEGNFVGDPLAKPWGTNASFSAGRLTIDTTTLEPGKTYEVRSSASEAGAWKVVVSGITVTDYQRKAITVDPATARFYELAEAGPDGG
jgi:uncharacterized protein (TIGR03790 family)